MNEHVIDLVAHRAGNALDRAAPAAAVADRIEIDVHVFRGRVEVRHAKVLWPFARQWEQWYLRPRGTTAPRFGELLAGVGPEQPLLIDVKCFSRRTARRVLCRIPAAQPVVVSSRAWWVLGTFAGRVGTRLRSCGNRAQLAVALRWPRGSTDTGVAVHERLLDADVLARLRRRASPIYAWGVRSHDRATQLVEHGVSGLIIDDLDLIARIRAGLDDPESEPRRVDP